MLPIKRFLLEKLVSILEGMEGKLGKVENGLVDGFNAIIDAHVAIAGGINPMLGAIAQAAANMVRIQQNKDAQDRADETEKMWEGMKKQLDDMVRVKPGEFPKPPVFVQPRPPIVAGGGNPVGPAR